MYTEAEAKEKWCPQMTSVEVIEDMDSRVALCCASRCMAWRPTYPKVVDGQMVPTGYCGLAGEPKRHGP